MTKKEVRKLAQQKIKEGKTQQQTFEEIKEESDRPAEEIAIIVKGIPTLAKRQKYKSLNSVLIGLLVLTIALKMNSGIPIVVEKGIKWFPIIFILPLINVFMLWGVSTFRASFHRFAAVLTMISVIRNLKHFLGESFEPMLILDLMIYGGIIFLGFYLQGKLTPGYATVKERYTNSEGQARLRNQIIFNDRELSA